MEKENFIKKIGFLISIVILIPFLGYHQDMQANTFQNNFQQKSQAYLEFKGNIVDSKTKKPLTYVDFNVKETNISTISNNEGEFILKVPSDYLDKTVIISLLGYKKKEIPLSEFKKENTKIELDISVTQLTDINIYVPKDALSLVRATLNKKGKYYFNDQTVMIAFYRETIKKRNKNASLSEALLQIYKQPNASVKNDAIKLIKSRKNTNYSRLDTLAIKLQGGPFSTLYTDIVKYPEFIFTENDLSDYTFSFDTSTQINNRPVYVVKFKQRINDDSPLYYGTLYIDSETLALTSAVYNLNVKNRILASQMFVKSKPRKVEVSPILASYRVDYRIRNEKWLFGYGNIQLTFKVNWKNRLFNNVYTLSSEMAITDWKINTDIINSGEKLKPNVILSDKASGFSDPEFWGEYNIIEPEKSIESAIKKINKQVERAET